MTRLWTSLLVPGIALAVAACAGPARPSAAPAPQASSELPTEKPKFKKPVRMNGRGELSSIPLEKFFELHQSAKTLVFDARPPFFFSIGHIPGAINLPKKDCDEAIHNREDEIKSALAAGQTIVVYCTSITCPDARAVADHISGFGYPAAIFSGGWDAWKDAGMPTE